MTTKSVPRKVPGLHLERSGEELRVFNPASDTAHVINPVASGVFEACDGSNDVDDIVDATADGIGRSVHHDVVVLALADLVEAGLVTVEPDVPAVSRRALIGRLGAGDAAAAALPVVESMTSSPPAPGLARRSDPGPRPTTERTPTHRPTGSSGPTPIRPFS